MEKFIEKLLTETFKDVSNREWHWYSTLYWYIVDSKEITRKRLDSFLKEQIDNPDPKVLALAKELRKGTKNFDELIIKILNYVWNNVDYLSDTVNFGKIEYWATAYETLFVKKKGDCDDINGTIHVLMRLACGEMKTDKENEIVIPLNDYFFSNIGDVTLPDGTTTGHYWNIYFSPKTGKWYPIDATYYPDFKKIGQGKKTFNLNLPYMNVWFYFNSSVILKQV